MGKNYINVFESERDVLTHIYVEDGVRKVEKELFKPFCAVDTKNETGWTDIHGRHVNPKVFGSISHFKEWKKENDGIIQVYGDIRHEYQFIASNYRGDIAPSKVGMNIYNFDIEVEVPPGTGFPDPEQALYPINAITIEDMVKGHFHSFAYKKPKKLPADVALKFYQCSDEHDLLTKFLDFWQTNGCDFMTGWNIRIFDVPYIVNRLDRVLGPKTHQKLSPCKKVSKVVDKVTENVSYQIAGVADFDYIELYKKFTYESRERYSLDYIAQYELGKEKLNFKDEHEDLYSLYHNDFDTFLAYNIKDVHLVSELDAKLKYIDLAMFVMYKAKCLPDDVFGTVKIWDAYLYNELMDRKIFCPPNKNSRSEEYPGGFVGDPEVGLHRWTMVFDVASSYPNQIISYNMSPETLVEEHQITEALRDIRFSRGRIERCIDQDELEAEGVGDVLRQHGVAMAPNGQFFFVEEEGILPSVIARLFNGRKEMKKQIKENKNKIKELEDLLSSMN